MPVENVEQGVASGVHLAPTDHTHDAHYRVRHDRIDDAGKVTRRHHGALHKIAVGRAWTHQPIVMLTLNPEHRYQPLTPTPKQQTTEP